MQKTFSGGESTMQKTVTDTQLNIYLKSLATFLLSVEVSGQEKHKKLEIVYEIKRIGRRKK